MSYSKRMTTDGRRPNNKYIGSNHYSHYWDYYHTYSKMIVDRLQKLRKQYEEKLNCLHFKQRIAERYKNTKHGKFYLRNVNATVKRNKDKVKKIDDLLEHEYSRFRINTTLYSKILEVYFKHLLVKIVNGYKYKIRGITSKLGSITSYIITRFKDKYKINWGATFKAKQELFDKGYKPEDLYNIDKVTEDIQNFLNDGYDEEDAITLANIYRDGKKYLQYEKLPNKFIKIKWFRNTNVKNANYYSFKPIRLVINKLKEML